MLHLNLVLTHTQLGIKQLDLNVKLGYNLGTLAFALRKHKSKSLLNMYVTIWDRKQSKLVKQTENVPWISPE